MKRFGKPLSLLETAARRCVPLLLAIALAFWAACSAHAGTITVSGTTTVTNVLSGHTAQFAVGDKFDFSFDYNDAATDSASSTSNGSFPTAITKMSLTRFATNTGSWNPASGTFNLPAIIGTSNGGNGQFVLSANGPGFPSSGTNFTGVVINCVASSAPPLVTDTGLGQTLAAQLGGELPGNISRFNTSSAMRFFFSGSEGSELGANLSLTSLNVVGASVPEPTSFALAGCGVAGFVLVARRRRNSAQR